MEHYYRPKTKRQYMGLLGEDEAVKDASGVLFLWCKKYWCHRNYDTAGKLGSCRVVGWQFKIEKLYLFGTQISSVLRYNMLVTSRNKLLNIKGEKICIQFHL